MIDVLIVDGSLTVRMDLKGVIEEAGYEAVVCDSIVSAREQLALRAYDLLILDALLPDENGADFLREIRSGHNTSSMPVMLMTSEGVREPARAGAPLADDCVAKPYDRIQIAERAGRLIRRHSITTGRAASESSEIRGQRILAIDDSPTYLHALADQLRREGFEVLQADSGDKGLDILRQQPVDAVLLDLLMPAQSGEETCRRIKTSFARHAPAVLMLTGVEDQDAMIASFNSGADDFIPKSSHFAVLHARLRAQLRRRQIEEESHLIAEQLHKKEVEAGEARANRELAETRAALLADLEKKNAELEEHIDGRKRLEDELRAALAGAESAKLAVEQANAAKDQFLAVLSHELRTPLTPVLAAVSLMERRGPLSADTKLELEIIKRNVLLEARLIDDLLDLTRIVRGKLSLEKKPVNICTVIERAVETCRPDIQARGLEFGVDLRGAPHKVNADISRLQQVFWNLLNNSIKFTAEGGCIGIRCYRSHQTVIVEVNDSGIGIDANFLPRIFDAFEQGEKRITRQFGGLGLGLAISKRLVEMHEGTIEAISGGKGQGATFKVTLPLVIEREEQQGGRKQIGEEMPAGGGGLPKSILLVEDHGDTSQMIRELLESCGYEVETSGDVAQALAAVARRSFDLLISDLGLPDRSGLDLMRELRERGITVPGIALSGFGREEDVLKSKEAGFAEHIVKPIDFEVLAALVKRVASLFPG